MRRGEEMARLAAERLGTKVTRIEHFGSYSCRNIRGGRRGEPSQHATANAIDVAGFRLADGETVWLEEDWDADNERGAFLRELHTAYDTSGSAVIMRGTLIPGFLAVLGPFVPDAVRQFFPGSVLG